MSFFLDLMKGMTKTQQMLKLTAQIGRSTTMYMNDSLKFSDFVSKLSSYLLLFISFKG